MKISYNWLSNYISPLPEPSQLAELLTNCGLEVESINSYESIKGGLEGLVVGEVLECEPHPNADRLSITRVNVGTGDVLQIVCGAPNVAKGQKVVVAKVGTMLFPSEGEAFEIKQSKIRGELSQGMICAEDEIGLGASHDGIMELAATAIPGTKAAEYFNIYSDTVFEIGLTPNRVDAASHFGTARDLYAVLFESDDIKLQLPLLTEHSITKHVKWDIKIENTAACPRYSGICIQDVKVSESPDWLKNSLKAIGLKPINNIVDATNYVLHELGHPLHAFDLNKVAGAQIVVRTCAEGTPFTMLDGKEIKLSAEDLMICDNEKPMCIAGVFGGIDSGVSEQTTSVFIESAYFNPVWVRKTAKRHGLKTDASFRFERGADPEITLTALKRVTAIICDIAGGHVISEILDHYPQPIEANIVKFSISGAERLIGENIKKGIILKIFGRLGMECDIIDEDNLMVKVPAFKPDVLRQADLVEELLRIYSYNKIAMPEKMRVAHVVAPKPDKLRLVNHISNHLVARGFTECMNNSLTSMEYMQSDQGFSKEEFIKILNPLSSELDVMRTSLLFGLLENVSYNRKRQMEQLKLFELGRTYHKLEGKIKEREWLSILTTGNVFEENWNKLQLPADYYFISGLIEQIIQTIAGDKIKKEKKEVEIPGIENAIAYFSGEKQIASFGKVIAPVQKHFDLNMPVFYGTIDMSILFRLHAKNQIKYKEVAKFPRVRRDLALLVDKNVKFQDIETLAWQTERKLLQKINLFDIYEGDKLEAGKKSYAVSFEFQDETQTLSDQQVEKTMKRIIDVLGEKLGTTLR
jgi:phenylalanyl-tRNA synthetase beta chain